MARRWNSWRLQPFAPTIGHAQARIEGVLRFGRIVRNPYRVDDYTLFSE
jgi:hypothetical protein